MQFVAKYEYNQNSYAIVLKKGYITFLKWCDNIYKECSNYEEKSLALEILSSITPDESNGEYISDITINSHFYRLFYDATNKLYYWHSQDGYDYEKDNIYLNQRYNHTLLVLYYNGKKNRKTGSNIFRLFYKNKRVIALLLTASISLSTLVGRDTLGMNNNQISYQNAFATKNVSVYIEEKENLLKENLADNPNLSPKEKEVIEKLSFLFVRYQGIINEQIVLERFRTLKIQYTGTIESGEAGFYNRIDNIITLHYSSFENSLLAIFIHEVLHVFQTGNGVHFLEELSNEYFNRQVLLELLTSQKINLWQLISPQNRETYNKEDVNSQNMDEQLYLLATNNFEGYDYYMDIYYLLSQLIDETTLARFQFEGNLSIIEKALLRKIYPSAENKVLVSKLSNASYFLRPIEDGKFNYYYDKSQCYTALNELFFKIKGHYLSQDAEACAYISRYGASNILEDYEAFMNDEHIIGKVVIPRTIFSSAIPYPIIYYGNNKGLEKRVINQDYQTQYSDFLDSKMELIRTESLQKF